MKVSRRTEYALRCVWYLALHPERTVTIAEIAGATEVPRSFLAKILQDLVREEVVVSIRGAKGGFRLAHPPDETSLYNVYVATEGRRASGQHCAVSAQVCGVDGYCALHPFWSGARTRFEKLLRAAKARDLISLSPFASLDGLVDGEPPARQ